MGASGGSFASESVEGVMWVLPAIQGQLVTAEENIKRYMSL